MLITVDRVKGRAAQADWQSLDSTLPIAGPERNTGAASYPGHTRVETEETRFLEGRCLGPVEFQKILLDLVRHIRMDLFHSGEPLLAPRFVPALY